MKARRWGYRPRGFPHRFIALCGPCPRRSAFDDISCVNPGRAANVLWFSSAVLCPVARRAFRVRFFGACRSPTSSSAQVLPSTGLHRIELTQIFCYREEDFRDEGFPQTNFRRKPIVLPGHAERFPSKGKPPRTVRPVLEMLESLNLLSAIHGHAIHGQAAARGGTRRRPTFSRFCLLTMASPGFGKTSPEMSCSPAVPGHRH